MKESYVLAREIKIVLLKIFSYEKILTSVTRLHEKPGV